MTSLRPEVNSEAKYSKAIVGVPQLPLRRSAPESIIGGVCSGLGRRLGIRPIAIRAVAVVLALLLGVGIVGYFIIWLAVPRDGETTTIARNIAASRKSRVLPLTALFFLSLCLWLVGAFFFKLSMAATWLLIVAALSSLAIWRGSSTSEKVNLQRVLEEAPLVRAAFGKGRRAVLLRVAPAFVLIIFGLNLVNNLGGFWGAALPALVGSTLLVLGVLVLLAPWWLEMTRDLSTERRNRIRIEERNVLVAHVHDSVLQTLTLIEKASGDSSEVIRLARMQERELRRWLYEPDQIGRPNHDDATFVQLLQQLQSEIEREYRIRVELVTVGDCPGNQVVYDVLAACREALVNSAKWSGESEVRVFAEMESSVITVFIRDNGFGFDVENIPEGRHGVSHSIVDRIHLLGGSTKIWSSENTGSEIQISVPVLRESS